MRWSKQSENWSSAGCRGSSCNRFNLDSNLDSTVKAHQIWFAGRDGSLSAAAAFKCKQSEASAKQGPLNAVLTPLALKAPRLPRSKSNGAVVCRVRWERLQQLKRKQPEASSSEQNPLEEVLEDVDPDFAARPVPIAEPVRKRRRAADVLLDSNSDADSSDEDIPDNDGLDWRAKQI